MRIGEYVKILEVQEPAKQCRKILLKKSKPINVLISVVVKILTKR